MANGMAETLWLCRFALCAIDYVPLAGFTGLISFNIGRMTLYPLLVIVVFVLFLALCYLFYFMMQVIYALKDHIEFSGKTPSKSECVSAHKYPRELLEDRAPRGFASRLAAQHSLSNRTTTVWQKPKELSQILHLKQLHLFSVSRFLFRKFQGRNQ